MVAALHLSWVLPVLVATVLTGEVTGIVEDSKTRLAVVHTVASGIKLVHAVPSHAVTLATRTTRGRLSVNQRLSGWRGLGRASTAARFNAGLPIFHGSIVKAFLLTREIAGGRRLVLVATAA